MFGFPGVFVSAYIVTLEEHFLSPPKAELVLGFASFSIHYPPCPGLKVVILTALPESGFGHHHTILFKTFHLFYDLFLFFSFNLSIGSSQP